MGFVHLRNHSHYSVIEALPSIDELLSAARDDDQKALAITDFGVLYGTYEFYSKAYDYGIKPIIGIVPQIFGFPMIDWYYESVNY